MVLIGLGVLTSLVMGLNLGLRIGRLPEYVIRDRPFHVFSSRNLFIFYFLSVLLSGTLQKLAWSIPQLTNPIIVISYCRFGLLYLMLRRLVYPEVRGAALALLLGFEVVIGFTGFFAGFKEALMLAALALLERFRWKKPGHWGMLAAVSITIVFTGLLWTGIKSELRSEIRTRSATEEPGEHLKRIGNLTIAWAQKGMEGIQEDMRRMIDRLWGVYYPALALKRVPKSVPHTDGAILMAAVKHVTMPRLIFPDKPRLPSDSEKVREYSGVWVAGEEEEASIAFGYAAESYVDYGIPLMFAPILVYGFLLGVIYRKLLSIVVHRELAIGLVTVFGWLALYIFERSWARTLGITLTMTVFLGCGVALVDRYFIKRQ